MQIMNSIEKLCNDLFLHDVKIIKLKGDYSERSIFRIHHSEGTFVGVVGNNIAENKAFLKFRNTFEEQGIAVPKLIIAAEDKGSYILEDLGDDTVKKYCDNLNSKDNIESIRTLYFKIVEVLPKIQTVLYDKIDFSFCYQRDTFDRENMIFDVARFEEYFLEKFYKKYDLEIFLNFKKKIIDIILQQSNDFFLYRDFQSRNFMVKAGKLYFIDFQSGRKGALQYDLASFIYSSGTINYDGMQDELIDHYLFSLRKYTKIDAFGVVRLMQAMGNYALYFYTRNDKTIYDKISTNLVQIKVLAEKMGIDCGIF